MANILVINDYTSESETSPEEYGDWSSCQNNNIRGIETVGEGGYYDFTVDKKIDRKKTYFLVAIEYGQGDSFGHGMGNIDYVHYLFEDADEAEKIKKMIEDDYEKDKSSYDVTLDIKDGVTLQTGFYKGYFERLEYVDITAVRIKGKYDK